MEEVEGREKSVAALLLALDILQGFLDTSLDVGFIMFGTHADDGTSSVAPSRNRTVMALPLGHEVSRRSLGESVLMLMQGDFRAAETTEALSFPNRMRTTTYTMKNCDGCWMTFLRYW